MALTERWPVASRSALDVPHIRSVRDRRVGVGAPTEQTLLGQVAASYQN
jgi:hypothetical protein